MAYVKTIWTDNITPLSATKLNKIEQGIADSIPLEQKGVANGVATLDTNKLIPTSQIPVIPVAQLGNVINSIETTSEVWELLASNTLSTATASITFSSLPSGYKRHKIIGHTHSNNNTTQLEISFNATHGTYYFSYSHIANGVFSSLEDRSAFYIVNGLPYNVEGDVEFIITSYGGYHTALWSASSRSYTTIGGGDYRIGLGTVITSLSIRASTSMDVGTTFEVYGCVN